MFVLSHVMHLNKHIKVHVHYSESWINKTISFGFWHKELSIVMNKNALFWSFCTDKPILHTSYESKFSFNNRWWQIEPWTLTSKWIKLSNCTNLSIFQYEGLSILQHKVHSFDYLCRKLILWKSNEYNFSFDFSYWQILRICSVFFLKKNINWCILLICCIMYFLEINEKF